MVFGRLHGSIGMENQMAKKMGNVMEFTWFMTCF